MAAVPCSDALAIDQHEAARLTGLSAKTLERLAAAGEPVGRVKIGRRVVFHRDTLVGWLANRATPQRDSSVGEELRQVSR